MFQETLMDNRKIENIYKMYNKMYYWKTKFNKNIEKFMKEFRVTKSSKSIKMDREKMNRTDRKKLMIDNDTKVEC